jgi:Flp pilus assembly protein TadB
VAAPPRAPGGSPPPELTREDLESVEYAEMMVRDSPGMLRTMRWVLLGTWGVVLLLSLAASLLSRYALLVPAALLPIGLLWYVRWVRRMKRGLGHIVTQAMDKRMREQDAASRRPPRPS